MLAAGYGRWLVSASNSGSCWLMCCKESGRLGRKGERGESVKRGGGVGQKKISVHFCDKVKKKVDGLGQNKGREGEKREEGASVFFSYCCTNLVI